MPKTIYFYAHFKVKLWYDRINDLIKNGAAHGIPLYNIELQFNHTAARQEQTGHKQGSGLHTSPAFQL